MRNKDYYRVIAAVISRHNNVVELAQEFSVVLSKIDSDFNEERFFASVTESKNIRNMQQFLAASKN